MTISAVLDRITQIQSQMQQLATFDQPASTSGSDFSSQLDSAVSSASSAGRVSTDANATGVAASGTAVPSDFGTAPATATQQAVLDDAKKYLGVPYLWGGTDPSQGLDCSGFVQRVYGDLGVQLPRVSGDQARAGTAVASLADAQPGDILAFGSPVHHVAIYAGNGEMIEAPHTGDHVKIIKVADFGEPVTQIRRVLPSGSASGTSAGTSAGTSSAAASRASLQDSVAASRAAYTASTLIGAHS